VKKVDMTLNGACTEILHLVRVQMDSDLDPERLTAELHKRARRTDDPAYGARCAQIKRSSQGYQCYVITLVNPEALPVIYAILREIDADIAAIQEHQRLLELLAEPRKQ
jgi:hypothetical protein